MDEKLRILKMVEDGTVTAEQGAELMAALDAVPAEAALRSCYDKKMFRILVDDVSGDKVTNPVSRGGDQKDPESHRQTAHPRERPAGG